MKKPVIPKEVGHDMHFLYIEWDDSQRCKYSLLDLRKNCPCAICAGGHDLDAERTTGSIRRIKLNSWNHIGRYALQFHWSDGHHDGFYTYQMLKEMCEEAHQEE